MRKENVVTVFLFLLLWSARSPALYGQRYEAGVQISGVHLHKIDESVFAIGVRFHYNATSLLAADLELTHAPESSSGHYGETMGWWGLRAGKHFNRFGAFAKGRTGLINFGGDYFAARLDHKTHFMVDMGGILEYYPVPHMYLRLEGGDTVIYYGGARLVNNPDPLGTVHNFQSAAGLGFHF